MNHGAESDGGKIVFQEDRATYANIMKGIENMMPKPFVRDQRGWILFGPQDVRETKKTWHFSLQKLKNQELPRVRVGCRYYTLKQAWSHWGKRRPGTTYTRRNHCAQAVAIIRLMLLQAHAYGLLSYYAAPLKFDSTLLKPKRKR
jgi:hypothetical protein